MLRVSTHNLVRAGSRSSCLDVGLVSCWPKSSKQWRETFEALQNIQSRVRTQGNLGVRACQHAHSPSLSDDHEESKHRGSQDIICGCSSTINCGLGARGRRLHVIDHGQIRQLRCCEPKLRMPERPVTLSLVLSELSHGANKNSRFVCRLFESSALQCNLAVTYCNIASKTRREEGAWPEIPR